jgi:hypothetical protein
MFRTRVINERLITSFAIFILFAGCGKGREENSASILANGKNDQPTATSAEVAAVSCDTGSFSVEKEGDDLRFVIRDSKKIAEFKARGWIKEEEIADSLWSRGAMRDIFQSYYRYFGTKKEGETTFFEFRWDESHYPPQYAFMEVWQIMENGYLAPLTTWDFADGACTFSDVKDNFDLPPPPPPQPDREFDATNCEFYINSLGKEQRHYGGGGYDEIRIVSYLSVNAKDLVAKQGGTITQVGMRLNGTDDVITTQELEPSYYVLRKTLWLRGYRNEDYDLRQLAYFIDVQRTDGMVDRLWLKDGWHDFNWPEVFDSYPQTVKYLGPNSDSYVEEPSPIYNQKKICIKN